MPYLTAKSFCYRPIGGNYKFRISDLLSDQTIDAKGSSPNAERMDCPNDGNWAISEVTNVQLCLPRDGEIFYLVLDLVTFEVSSFPELVSNDISSIIENGELILKADGKWFETSVSDKRIPDLTKRHVGESVGKPMFVTNYYGQLLVAIEDRDGSIHFVPMPEDLDQIKNRDWMSGLVLNLYWGDLTSRIMSK